MSTPAEDNIDPVDRRQKIAVATVFVAAMFINVLDATAVNVALPAIASQFRVPVEHTATINIGFLVAVAVTIPVSGWLGDRIGAREVFIAAIALFTLSSAACGLAGSLDQLVVFRIIQGAAGGLMTPVGMAMLYRTYPPAERVALGRITTVPIAAAPAIGPVIGGLLTEKWGWEWIFWINLPIGSAAVIYTLWLVRPLVRTTGNALDVPGFLLAGAGFAGLMYALAEGPAAGWASPQVMIPGVTGLALLAILIPVELRSTRPMLQLRLLTLRLFRSANLVSLLSSAGFIGALFVYPLMLQNAFGHGPLVAGLLTFPEALGIMLGVQVAARLYTKLGPRYLLTIGQAIVTLLLVTIAIGIQAETALLIPALLMFTLGIGQALTFMPTQAAAFDTVPRRRTGEGTSLYNVFRQAGNAFGVALGASVIAMIGTDTVVAGAADPLPFRAALLACAACNALAVIVALTINNDDAAPSRGLSPHPV